jgi:lipoprotein-anchoring transpeptidase ErfK/SrfK
VKTVLLAVVAALASGCHPAAGANPSRDPSPAAVEASAVAMPLPAPPAAEPASDGEPCPAGWRCDRAAFSRSPRPVVTEILVQKAPHLLHLVAGRTIVQTYGVALGGGGMGQKRYEGDRGTPVGSYHVTGRYPSPWHTYLSLDYPNDEDRRRYDDLVGRGEVPAGKGPGSAIAIHGHRAEMPERLHKLVDWTLGCVALDNAEIDEVAAVAPIGTKVVIE